MNKTGVFTIEIQKESKGNRTYKKYDINFICEFTWNNTTQYIEKYNLYAKSLSNVHFADCERDGFYYFYIRHKKYLLKKGVNLI